MNLLSSSKPSPLTTTATASPASPVPSPTSCSPTNSKQMTISMAFPASNKGGPLDLSAADRIVAAPDCPKLLKPEDLLRQTGENDVPPKLDGEKSSEASTSEQKPTSPTAKPESSTAPKTDDVSSQLKTLTEIFKSLASTPNASPDAAASLLELLNKKTTKDDTNDPLNAPDSLEALHQLGWHLINIGRGNTSSAAPPPNIPTPQVAPSTAAPMWMPSRPSMSRPVQQPTIHPPPPPLSGISMRGNQKYSAFYQHNRKQTMEEGEALRQSTAAQLQRLGFPPQAPNRRVNGPPATGHQRGHFPNPAEASLKPSLSRLSAEVASPPRSRETAFLCSCGQDFDSLYVFTLHMKDTGHKPRSSQPERDIPKLVRGQDMWINSETEQTREILRCMRCNQSFRSLPELTMHMMKTSHYSEIVYSDAGRNLLASQTLSSVGDRSRAGGMAGNWSGMKGSSATLKRSVRTGAHPQNGTPIPAEPTKPLEVGVDKMNGQQNAEGPRQREKSPKRDEPVRPPKCERPASSYELHVVKPSPKPASSPDAMSCPSELQRSAASSPRNDLDKHDHKYLSSPGSSRGNTSPRGSTTDEKNCSDSVIRQIESFVEKSLPFPSLASPSRSSWQQRQSQGIPKPSFQRPSLSPLAETETSRSTPEKSAQRKRRFSSGSSASTAAPTVTTPTETSAPAEKRPSLSFSTTPLGENASDGSGENPLSSLQKLVETTHQSGGNGNGGMKSPNREMSSVPSTSSNEAEMPNKLPSTSQPAQQPNIAAALSALQTFMTKVSPGNEQKLPEIPKVQANGEGGEPPIPANWMGLLTAVLNAAKQGEGEPKRPDAPVSLPSPSKFPPNPMAMFGQPPSVFTSGAFDFSVAAGKPLSLPVHMSTAPMGAAGSSMVANITKKAKCHFCGKPFANKGQVRLHISKNKCPCLLQQSAAAAAMVKPPSTLPPVSNASVQPGDKRPLPFPYPGFPANNPGPLGAPDLSRLFGGQPPNPADQKPGEAAALAALLRHFNLPQPSRPVSASQPKPNDLLATLARAANETNPAITAANPLFSLLFPSAPAPVPAPQPAPLDSTGAGLSAEQKALFLFAQAMASLAVAGPPNKPPEEALPLNPLTNILQSFNFPLGVPPAAPMPPVTDPEALGPYLSAIRQIAAIGAVPPPQTSTTVTTTASSSEPEPSAPNS